MVQFGKQLRFKSLTVKTKLLLAFSVLVLVTVFVSSIALQGFSNTNSALKTLQEKSIPQISAALELADQSSTLAAFAPFLGSVQVMNKLDTESQLLFEMLEEFMNLVEEASQNDQESESDRNSKLLELAHKLDSNLRQLVETTQENLSVRSDGFELNYALFARSLIFSDLSVRNRNTGGVGIELTEFHRLTEIAFTVRAAESPFTLSELKNEYSMRTERLINSLSEGHSPIEGRLRPFLKKQSEVFDLRLRQIGLDQRIRFLLSTINSLSNQMSELVAKRVAYVTANVEEQGAQTALALNNGRTKILILSAFSILMAAFIVLYVIRDLAGNLEAVTQSMSRLAAGDQTATVPGEHRRDEIGSLARAFRVFRDHSEENEILAAKIAENSKTLEAMFDNMTDGLSVFDEQGRLAAWNRQFATINELDEAEIYKGMPFNKVIESLTNAGMKAQNLDGKGLNPDDQLEVRKHQSVQYEHSFPGGRLVELRSKPIPEKGFVTSYTDLTERKKMEETIRQAQRMEAVGQLTGGIAHDFNNLLAAITGNLQLLHADLNKDPILSKRVVRALDASERGASVTQRLLAFSSQQKLHPELTDINELVGSLQELLGYSFSSAIHFEANLKPKLPKIMVDAGQLENALLNLVFNSRDAIEGEGTITIKTESFGQSNKVRNTSSGIVLWVIDTGSGMSDEVLNRVYEPFFTTKSPEHGTGLGLSMVYGFVRQSGGNIDISSKQGQGTSIRIFLPATDIVRQTDTQIPHTIIEPGRGEAILIVEDDKIVRETATDLVENLGYTATSVSTFAQAKSMLKQRPFDLLFTDVMLPRGHTGIEVAEFARSVLPDIGVLFASGFTESEISKTISNWPNAELIQKPYRKQVLSKSIRQQLRRNVS